MVWHGMVWYYEMVRYDMLCYAMIWYYDIVWYDTARYDWYYNTTHKLYFVFVTLGYLSQVAWLVKDA
jgi:hypothetical protein